jgi:hypothetical protein
MAGKVLNIKVCSPLKLHCGLTGKSRMTGDCHVRFCERLRVKLPLPTRQFTVVCKRQKQYDAIIIH